MRPPATFLARLPEPNAVEARFDAWLNLSHREKATVFVMVRTRAITRHTVSIRSAGGRRPSHPARSSPLTDQRQPKQRQLGEADKAYDGEDAEQDPQRGLRVQRKPEEALVGRVDLARLWIR